MIRWYSLASSFFLLQTFGAFTVVSELYYGTWKGGFTASTKMGEGLNLLMILVSLGLFWRGLRRTGSISTGGKLAILLAVFLLASIAWSVDPSTTFRRGFLYVFFILGVIGVATNLKGEELVNLVSTICFMLAVASIVFLVISPSLALMHGDEEGPMALEDGPMALKGVFAHKNVLGQVMAAGTLAGIHQIRANNRGRLRNIFKIIVLFTVALASKSATSILIILYIYYTSGVIIAFRRGGLARILGVSFTILLAPIVVALALFPDSFLEMIGKDPTLSGRTGLWDIVITNIFQRPLQGWGFFAFWGPANPVANAISSNLRWHVVHAHNGLLEILLEVGITGTALFMVLFFRNITLACRCLKTSAREFGVTSLLCYGAIVFTGMTESVLLDTSGAWSPLFFMSGLICERAMRAVRRGPVRRSGSAARRSAGSRGAVTVKNG